MPIGKERERTVKARLELWHNRLKIEEFFEQPLEARDDGSLRVFSVDVSDRQDWDREEGQYLLGDLYALTRSGFCKDFSHELWEDTKNHVVSGQSIYLVCADKIVAYAVFDCWNKAGRTILYLSGIIVCPSHQGMGISTSLLRLTIDGIKPDFLAARTQNPVMYESIRRSCRLVFPNTDNGPPRDIVEIGCFVAWDKLTMADYDPEKMVGIGTYGNSLYGSEPSSQTTELDRWFKRVVNVSRGDSMIVVGVM